MFTIKQQRELINNLDGNPGGGYMIYLVYLDSQFQSAHLSFEAADAWVAVRKSANHTPSTNHTTKASQPPDTHHILNAGYRKRGGCIT